jgi:glucosamine kinase
LRAALSAYDGLAPTSALTAELLAAFGDDPVAMVRWASGAKPGDYGAFAPRVLKHAAGNDPVALEIIRDAARAIGMLTRGVVALGAERVALVGGMGEALRPYFEPDIAARLKPPLYDPTDGAILFVGGALPSQGEVAQ